MRSLLKFVTDVRFNDLPEEVVKQAKKCILDFLGCVILGSQEKPSKILLDYIRGLGGSEEATIAVSGDRTTCFNAALANGSIAHVLELDDSQPRVVFHAGNTTIPAALAVAEREEAGGKDFMTAVVVGYELGIRFGSTVTVSALQRKYHMPGLTGSFGAAAAVGRLIGLDEIGLTNALGICGNLSPTALVIAFKQGNMVKNMFCGWPDAVGVIAGDLAQKGFTGTEDILENWASVVVDKYEREKLMAGFGKKFEIMGTRFKPYASCALTQSAIEATFRLLEKYPSISASDVTHVTVEVQKRAAFLSSTEPKTPIAAKFSTPYCVAMAIITQNRDAFLKDIFKEEQVSKPSNIRLAKKIELVNNPEFRDEIYEKKQLARVTIETKTGKKYAQQVDGAKGTPRYPLTDEELQHKFRTLASSVFQPERVEEIIRAISQLEKVGNMKEIARLLCTN